MISTGNGHHRPASNTKLPRIKFAGLVNDGTNLILAGDNHSLVKLDPNSMTEIFHSEMPISPLGLAIDSSEKTWIHNSINNKLMCFDSLLQVEKEFDAHETEHFNGTSTIWAADQGKKIYWYKGESECLVLSNETGEILEEIDYLVKDVDILLRINELETPKNLLVITNSRAKDQGIIYRLTNQTGTCKANVTAKYSDITEGRSAVIY